MFKRRFRLPSPALVISMVTLSLVLGGTAVAATATHGDKKADTKLVKKLAPTLSVKHAATADSATNAGHATTADSATNATNATNATHATSADNATNATNAGNANTLNGLDASNFAPRAFAKINSDGTVVANRSRGITQSQISLVGTTGFCISGLSFAPLIAQATLTNFDVGEITADVAPNVGACAAGTQVRVTTYNDSGAVTARGFSVFIY